jgi:hypothetical protein
MKKIAIASLLAVLALTVFTGAAGAQTSQPGTDTLHDYMEKALAEKLGVPLATIEAQFDAGKTMYQIALDNGIAAADVPALMQEVRENAIQAALADGVLTQAQADWMLKAGGRGMGYGMMGRGAGYGMMRGGFGSGPCGGTGIPVRSGTMRGGFRR